VEAERTLAKLNNRFSTIEGHNGRP
jgi:hypothetical protein